MVSERALCLLRTSGLSHNRFRVVYHLNSSKHPTTDVLPDMMDVLSHN